MAVNHLGRSSFGNPANAGNTISIEEAQSLLYEWVPNERLRLHMKQVAALMRAWAVEKETASEETALNGNLPDCCMMLTGKNIRMTIVAL